MLRAAAVAAGVVLVGVCGVLAGVQNLVWAPRTFLVLFFLGFAAYALGVWTLARLHGPFPMAVILGVGLACRAALLPAVPTLSTDAFRYVWDARVASAGITPYAYPPAAPELELLRDEAIYPHLNHRTWRTIYPPGAQLFFRTVYALAPDSVLAMKVGVALAELAALGLLAALLPALGLPATRLVIYAWNPLVLVELWGSAHLDALAIATVVGAVYAAHAGRRCLAAVLLAAGTLVKLYPAILLPLLLGPRPLPVLATFAAIVAAGYAPVAHLGLDALGSLPRYTTEMAFNVGLARALVADPAVTLASIGLWIAWAVSRRRSAPMSARAATLIGGFIVLSPTIFPWYAAWLVPFLAITASIPWIAFTGTIAFAYAFYLPDPWSLPAWARLLEWSPLAAGAARAAYLALAAAGRAAPRALAASRADPAPPAP